MGPKLFTALAVLIGMSYFGDVAVWRVQHSPVGPPIHCRAITAF
jgi:hypothetical protein